MAKANPDKIRDLALKLARIDGLDRAAFNRAMRIRFPDITTRTLRQVYQDARIILAIKYVTERRADIDE